MKRNFEINEKYLNWTPEAVRCYERGCVCFGCIIQEIMEIPCRMDSTVIKILQLKGKPPKEIEIDIDEVLNYLETGKTLNEIADILNVPRKELFKRTKAFGIKGYNFKGGEFHKRNKLKRRKNDGY